MSLFSFKTKCFRKIGLLYYELKTEVDGYYLLSLLVGEQDKFEIEGAAMERNELVI